MKETQEQKQQRELVETIASNIAELSQSVKALLNGRVSRKAIIILLAHSTQHSQATVKTVLEALENLEKDYLKK